MVWMAAVSGGTPAMPLPCRASEAWQVAQRIDPFEFTHQGTPWTAQKDKKDVAWNGTEPERQKVEADFDRVQAWSKAQNRPVYLGEFGAYDKAEMGSRVRWTSFVARQAEARGWSWGYWQFTGDFILFNMQAGQWSAPIRDALVPVPVAGK